MSRDEVYDIIKEDRQNKFNSDRERFLMQAIKYDDGNWIKHTDFHWSRMLKGFKLDYWPSRKKWQYRGKIKRGDVYHFINCKEKK